MTESDHQHPASGGEQPSPAPQPGRYFGLLLASAVLATGGVVVAGWYGVRTELLALKALALQAVSAAISFWLCLGACRIRKNWAEARQFAEQAAGGKVSAAPRWGADEYDEEEEYDAYDIAQGNYDHAWMVHCLFFAIVPSVILGLLAVHQLWTQDGAETGVLSSGRATALGVVCLVASCIWLVLARSYATIAPEDLPESRAMRLVAREAHWSSILVAAGLLGSLIWPACEVWVGRVLLLWVVAVTVEQIGRVVAAWLHGPADPARFVSPLHVLLREMVFTRGNPITSAFEVIEARFGVSFRSSWAIRFVRNAAFPMLLLAVLLFWGLSGLSMVGPNELGVRESFGRISGDPLPPGLHLKLPWPFGEVRRYPVKTVFTMPIGYILESPDGDSTVGDSQATLSQSEAKMPKAFLWSRPHAKKEFELVLGNGNEAVTINAMVYYKIAEQEDQFLNYVYHSQNPRNSLEGFAYRVLMEKTRAKTLEEVLSLNRAEFARELKSLLRKYVAENQLGIDVIEVALIDLHPPIKVAPDYLDVISARIDAHRYEVDATGEKLVNLQDAEKEKDTTVSSAKVAAARRVGVASEQTAQIAAVRQAYSVAPEAFRLRYRLEALEQTLSNNPVILVDPVFELFYDLRPKGQGSIAPVPSGTRGE